MGGVAQSDSTVDGIMLFPDLIIAFKPRHGAKGALCSTTPRPSQLQPPGGGLCALEALLGSRLVAKFGQIPFRVAVGTLIQIQEDCGCDLQVLRLCHFERFWHSADPARRQRAGIRSPGEGEKAWILLLHVASWCLAILSLKRIAGDASGLHTERVGRRVPE